jgi:hypothetical protein
LRAILVLDDLLKREQLLCPETSWLLKLARLAHGTIPMHSSGNSRQVHDDVSEGHGCFDIDAKVPIVALAHVAESARAVHRRHAMSLHNVGSGPTHLAPGRDVFDLPQLAVSGRYEDWHTVLRESSSKDLQRHHGEGREFTHRPSPPRSGAIDPQPLVKIFHPLFALILARQVVALPTDNRGLVQ